MVDEAPPLVAVNMRADVAMHRDCRKPLAERCHGGLASHRRARGKSDQRRSFGGRGLMAATVATVAYLGLEARAVEVQVQLSSGLPRFTIVGLARQGGRAKVASGSGRRSLRSVSRSRPRPSPSTSRPPTCPRRGRITTFRSRSACSRRSAQPMPRPCRIMSRLVNYASTGGSPRRPACCSPRSTLHRRTRG